MSEFNIKIDIKSALDKIKSIEKATKGTKKAMNLIGDYMVKSVHENFLQSGRPDKWKELSLVTMAKKLDKSKGKARAKKESTNKILMGLGMRGGLMGSIHYNATNNSVVISPNKPYAAIHQFGGMSGKNKKVKIPARPYMKVQDNDMTNIKEIIEKEIFKDLK